MKRVLILENYRHTLAVARSLSRSGYEVHAGIPEPDHRTAYDRAVAASDAVDQHWEHPSFNAWHFPQSLAAYCHRQGIDAIFPVGEVSLPVLDAHAGELPPVTGTDAATAALCLDKSRFNEKALAAGFPMPETRRASTAREIGVAITEVGLPCVIKPVDGLNGSVLGEKSLIVRDSFPSPRELKDMDGTPVLVQEFMPGRRHNCMFLANHGELSAYFQCEVLRSTGYPEGTGYGTLVRSVAPDSYLKSLVGELLEDIGYHGPGCVQFLMQGGKAGFLECNPRLDANVAIAIHCGVDFPRLAVEACENEAAAAPEPMQYPAGQRLHWWLGDVESGLHALAAHKVNPARLMYWQTRAALDSLRADCSTIFSWRDPRPTRVLARHLSGAAYRRVTGKQRSAYGKG